MEFGQYIFNQGQVINKQEVSSETFEKYKDVLPEQVLELWKTYGFSSISNGLLNLINPNDYESIREDWEAVNKVLALKDQKEYLIGYSAFGDLVFFVVEDNEDVHFSVYNILYNKYEIIGDSEFDFLFETLFDDDTFVEEYFSESLFKECYEKLGALENDEVYGFVPLPVLGGDKTIEYAQKVKLNGYLKICAQSHV